MVDVCMLCCLSLSVLCMAGVAVPPCILLECDWRIGLELQTPCLFLLPVGPHLDIPKKHT